MMQISPPPVDDLQTPFEMGDGNQSTTYADCISWYEKLDRQFDEVKMLSYGTTAIGKPLNLVVISKDKNFNPEQLRKEDKRILLINNGIHPGEPDGIDASMMFARDLLKKKEFTAILDHVVVIIIPVYNVSGMLNRSSSSRANQNGPEEYGFRGNAQNYDLNRDFVKCDSREAETFTKIFRDWQPEIFIDTHVSNGADYQYTMTLIPSQPDKLHSILASYQEKILLPALNEAMKKDSFEMTPYVNSIAEIPDSGLAAFLETPRYSSGYAALYNCIGMMPETHMLKAYSPRVWSTYHLLKQVCIIVNHDYKVIGENKKKADAAIASQQSFALNWKLDESNFEMIAFKGYEAKYKPSDVSGLNRLYYDRSEPFEKEIKYYNHYKPIDEITKPFAYLIPQCWEKVIERLKWNGVKLQRLSRDTVIHVNCYYIDDFKTAEHAFEGHYLHSEVKIKLEEQTLPFYKGDYIVFPDQAENRYLIEMLEPQGVDSYFAWNFFDAVLMEKEYFSDYVWEDRAADLLQEDVKLKDALERHKKDDVDFAKNAEAQLYFIYTHSSNFEKSYKRYPVMRIENKERLPVE